MAERVTPQRPLTVQRVDIERWTTSTESWSYGRHYCRPQHHVRELNDFPPHR
ncbi:hypothetical protein ACGFNY_41160 [Streptomyces chartreusis]|uniref:hypothetical protein n=1 Tax=Streptomyces chartreusis TaxID=1969 RepID=UPI003721A893